MFRDKVYNLTKKIPKGKVTTYKKIAGKLNVKAYRAVGQALRCNPYASDVVPCHRVVKNNGEIGGYAGIMNNKKKVEILEKEGIKIKNNKIINFEEVLFNF